MDHFTQGSCLRSLTSSLSLKQVTRNTLRQDNQEWEAHSIDQAKLWQIVAIPAPVKCAVKILVWVDSPVNWVQVVDKLSKVM